MMERVVIKPPRQFTDAQYYDLCLRNRELRFERTAEGSIIVQPPTGGETGYRNADISAQVANWAKQDGLGAAFDSSTGFNLPNGADRSPDAAWVERARLLKLTKEQKKKFLPLCPDFVLELLSPTDELAETQAKMKEYLSNGAKLGWLIDPEERRVFIYRPNQPVEIQQNPERISGDPELPGFVLELAEIWDPNF